MTNGVPEQTQVGQYKVLHNIDIGLVTVQKPGLLVPEVVHTINYNDRTQAEEKQAEAVKWAEDH
jgi:hypothetical protein